MKRGHTITREAGDALASDHRKRRFGSYKPQRAVARASSSGGSDNPLRTVKTKASCAARNITTGAMTSVSCDLYITAADGTVTDSGTDVNVFNPGGLVGSGTWMEVLLNQAGEYEFVVARCGS